jgi:polyphosphate kinase
MNDENKFINREISWLYFNDRVLQEAEDKKVPIIERMRFLGIFSNNLDEFFRVRVATLRRLMKFENKQSIALAYSPQNLLNQIQELVIFQQKKFRSIYQEILKELAKNDVNIIDEKQLNQNQKEYLSNYYKEKVEPQLVPIMLRNAPKFPYLKDRTIYLFAAFNSANSKKIQYSLIEIPTQSISRFVEIPAVGKKRYLIYLEDVIRFSLPQIFAIFNPDIIESYVIKITRDAELDLDDDISESFYEKLKKSLEKRKKGAPVRFIYDENIPLKYLSYLLNKIKLHEDDNVIPGGRYHNFKDFIKFPNIGKSSFEYEKLPYIAHPFLKSASSILDVVRKQDLLLHFPYQNFDYIIDMIREAAIDPMVLKIEISIYRLASDSKIINALINASINGKEVVAVVELQARFDEEANLQWSKQLTDEGVVIRFGISGLKVHSKLILITRKEAPINKRFAFIGTGNFHEGTAKRYSDLALLTANDEITLEVKRVFDFMEKPYIPVEFKHLMVSPVFMRDHLIKLIDFEIDQSKRKKKASIRLKLNSLLDETLILKLYEASQAGVKIDLIVRGICSLIPGVKGLSENIKAISIVDKYLEHVRILNFYHAGENKIYISSADWMQRNLDLRVEVACPIYNEDLKSEIMDFFNIQWSDNTKARIFDGKKSDKFVKTGKIEIRAQDSFYHYLNNKKK